MTKIFYMQPEPCWTQEDEEILCRVSTARREKIDRYKFDKDKKLALYGALLARYGIVNLSGCGWDEIEIQKDENGKPQIKYPQNLYFNISHTEGRVLCAVSDFGPVGVDVEGNRIFDESVMKLAFSNNEIDYVNRSADKKKAFFEIWTKKEAYTKFLGLGLACDCKNIDVLDDGVSRKLYGWSDGIYCYSICCEDDLSAPCITELQKDTLQSIL